MSTLRATRWRRAVQRRRSPRATGASASLISAIGQDPLGDEILKVAEANGVNTRFVIRARIGLPAGTVLVTVDANGNATYELVQPVAWDEIKVLPETLEAVAQARGLIFGSLAGRSPYNLDQMSVWKSPPANTAGWKAGD